MNWHIETPQSTASRIGADISVGLTTETARRRLELHGSNRLRTREPRTLLQYFGEQLSAVLVVILFATAVISAVIAVNDPKGGNWLEALFVVLMTLLIALAGALIDRRIDILTEQLDSMTSTRSRVMRDGVPATIPSHELVPGDIVMLEAGDLIPADGRLISAHSLVCDQKPVTDDDEPSHKDAEATPHVTTPLPQRDNMVYAGCSVLSGSGAFIVTETGVETEFGKRAMLVGDNDEHRTPLQAQLANMGKHTAAAGLIICLIIFVVGFIWRHPNEMKAIEVFMTCMALTVAAIPEWTASFVTLIRLHGALDMVQRGVLIRDLDCDEKLSCVTVICTGKGGTVDQNNMSVVRAWTPGGLMVTLDGQLPSEVTRLLKYAALCCATAEEIDASGNPQPPGEAAIVRALETVGDSKESLDKRFPRVGIEQGGDTELPGTIIGGVAPYDSEKKQMTTVHRIKDRLIAVTRGTPDSILPLCIDNDLDNAHAVCSKLGSAAMHVVVVAYRFLAEPLEDPAPTENDRLTFMGVLGLSGAPDEDTRDSAAICRQAGIRVVMTSSDQTATAAAVAKSIGILRTGEELTTSARIAELSDKELENSIRKFSVYADVSAEDKQRIVRLWRQSGETVMATGASVADVPVLREADIGCAMGMMGTGVARGSSDISVEDDSFSTMICAINGGRTIFDNICKAVSYILSCSLGRVLAIGLATLITGATSLLPLQLLLSFFVTGFIPVLAMCFEPPEEGLMLRQPRRADHSMFTGSLVGRIVFCGIIGGIAAAGAFFIGRADDMDTARTMTFATLTCGQLLLALSLRSYNSVLGDGFIENKPMLITVGSCLAFIILIMLLPVGIFVLTELTAAQVGIVIGLSLAPFVLSELAKFIVHPFARTI